jgi:hypothetical protein
MDGLQERFGTNGNLEVKLIIGIFFSEMEREEIHTRLKPDFATFSCLSQGKNMLTFLLDVL